MVNAIGHNNARVFCCPGAKVLKILKIIRLNVALFAVFTGFPFIDKMERLERDSVVRPAVDVQLDFTRLAEIAVVAVECDLFLAAFIKARDHG